MCGTSKRVAFLDVFTAKAYSNRLSHSLSAHSSLAHHGLAGTRPGIAFFPRCVVVQMRHCAARGVARRPQTSTLVGNCWRSLRKQCDGNDWNRRLDMYFVEIDRLPSRLLERPLAKRSQAFAKRSAAPPHAHNIQSSSFIRVSSYDDYINITVYLELSPAVAAGAGCRAL
ncbi:hypothetical protein EVAR_96794_1 [Eumeta japonica]|uniref:Uncharacterized protein n=1 Tax=Eumeta variegata TaxID=151549 RepID=A0A4C1WDJ1_EUMVA|nr:hypothetical protein EVAR_96794_1 [Eumeta japonica]